MPEPFSYQFVDVTECITVDVAVKAGGDMWPSMVGLDFYENGGSILSNDARTLGRMLIEAAESADAIDAKRFSHDQKGSTE